MKILLIIVIIIALFTAYEMGIEEGISMTADEMSKMICSSKTIEELRKKLKE